MTDKLSFANKQEFEKFCAQHPDNTHLIYKDSVYDVTEFTNDHPGGPEFLIDFKNKDVSEVFNSPEYHEHSDNALRMLPKYKIGIIASDDGTTTNKKTDEVEAYPRITKDRIEYNGFYMDRNQGLVKQVLKLTKDQYMHMIHNSIHLPSCRLFDSDFLEYNSKNPWYRIPIFWTPVCIYLMYQALTFDYSVHSSLDNYILYDSPNFSLLAVIMTFFFGMFVWSFTEYSLHRLVFHFDDPLPNNKWAIYLHFLLHGVHHLIPMDPDRLVFPPPLAVAIYSILFPILTTIFSGNLARVIVVGFLCGYMCYDMTHIYIHHASPSMAHFKEMKKYHNKHHYVDGNKGFGITSKFWDKIFKTELL